MTRLKHLRHLHIYMSQIKSKISNKDGGMFCLVGVIVQ